MGGVSRKLCGRRCGALVREAPIDSTGRGIRGRRVLRDLRLSPPRGATHSHARRAFCALGEFSELGGEPCIIRGCAKPCCGAASAWVCCWVLLTQAQRWSRRSPLSHQRRPQRARCVRTRPGQAESRGMRLRQKNAYLLQYAAHAREVRRARHGRRSDSASLVRAWWPPLLQGF